jgi:hypothetical protein
MEIVAQRQFYFPEEVWKMIKKYINIYGIPVDFVPRIIKLPKAKICLVSERLIGYNPAKGGSLERYKKDRLLKNILKIFFNKISKDFSIPMMYKLRIAIDYMDRGL